MLGKTSFFLPLEAAASMLSELGGKTSRGFLTLPLMEFLFVGVVEFGRFMLDEARWLLFFSPKDPRRLS